ncbi:hypothetical protein [Limnoglobus roseus]|uniref:Uncharacterized protein n=1 Tax=Limnoglobus roseus TaxID=2598579 RepID=A0A5C1AUT3_9BACT|nr:hypothetical protein [Limnoglobus roseus]QEL20558.1 hypothetical protein PX52LOC_07663 [Limnoglobus roseus]
MRGSTAAGTVESDGWGKLAEALKAPEADKGRARVRLPNRIGEHGWELVAEHWPAERGLTATWAFRRKVD